MSATMDPTQRALSERRFYGGMALAIIAIVFFGFAQSFYLKPMFPERAVPPEPIFIVHGIAFTAWILLVFFQTNLIARKRADMHRKAGAFGAVLAVAMVVLGVLAGLVAAHRPTGFVNIPVPPLQFLAVPLFGIALFALFVALAIAWRRDAQSHKRLMLLATVQLATPAIARMPGLLKFGPPAFFGLTDLLVVALAIWDFRSRGKLHPVTLWGGILTILAQPAQLMISGTPAWLDFARWATGFLG